MPNITVTAATPGLVARDLAHRFRARRLGRALTQAELANAAGISRDTVKGFENTGRITLENLLRLAAVLGALPEFAALLPLEQPRTLADLEARASVRGRVRGRRRDAGIPRTPRAPVTPSQAPPIVTVTSESASRASRAGSNTTRRHRDATS